MSDEPKVSVLMENEGTYPFVGGGVSTWCHILCENMPDIDWVIFAVVADPYGNDCYDTHKLPQIRKIIRIPLWGAEETAEFIDQRNFRDVFFSKLKTTDRAVSSKFLPLFRSLLDGMETDSNHVGEVGRTVYLIYKYFQEYDYNYTIKSRETWNLFRDHSIETAQKAGMRGSIEPSLFDLTTCLRWFYNMFIPIACHVPETDVTHASIAASTALAGIVSKFEYGTPMLLTDHGVYIRERYIACSAAELTPFCKRFLVKLAGLFTRLCYYFSDEVAPCAHFNARWELPFGCAIPRDPPIDFSDWHGTGIVPNLKAFPFIRPTYEALVENKEIEGYDEDTEFPWIRTIYNGVDIERFVPGEKPENLRGKKTCVALARVFPLKDVLTMIRSCAVVKEKIPDVEYIVYGSLKADPPYVAKCNALIEELGLKENFNLAGYHSKPHQAFWEGDISVLSSISEGFPFTVLESMSCGVPVVGTDVGGVKEGVGFGADACGIVVKPQDPEAFGQGVLKMLSDDRLRGQLARKSRERIERLFQTETSVDAYAESYRRLAQVKRMRVGSSKAA